MTSLMSRFGGVNKVERGGKFMTSLISWFGGVNEVERK